MNNREVLPDAFSPERDAHDALMTLGDVAVRFAGVERAPRHPDGTLENDVEHSFHLALSATELAATYFPDLDTGLVAQFSLVHDLPEVYAGDVRTFEITPEELEKKEAAEREATERLLKELPPHTAQLLQRYELQEETEARFVRFVDKMLPGIINMMAGDACTFKEDYGVQTLEDLRAGRDARLARLQALFPDFPFLHMVEDLVSQSSERALFPDD